MTIQEMKRKKKEKGYTYVQIAELSGVPLGTVQKIFNGETTSPRYDTLLALERLFSEESMVREAAPDYGASAQGRYTVDDYRTLPEERRVELIDGYFYDMASPTVLHQRIAGEIHRQIANFIMDRGGDCQPLMSPVDIQLDCDERTMVQSDVAIVCHPDRLRRWGVYGAPDFILEVVSPSTKRKDYTRKLYKYMEAGVKEYWILDPYQRKVLVYFFESDAFPVIHGLNEPIAVEIYGGELKIQFEHIEKWIEQDSFQ